MADQLFEVTRLGDGAPVGQLEDGIVAEAGVPARLEGDAALERPFASDDAVAR